MAIEQYVNLRDLEFLLYEVGDADALCSAPPFDRFERSDVLAMIEEAARLAEGEFEGLAKLLDENEPALVDGRVVTPPEQAKALRAFVQMGIPSASFPPEYGGMDLPYSISMAVRLPVQAVGGSTLGYLFLTSAAANMLAVVGNEEQKATYMPPMVAMEWFGTMMLSETEAGSSLGDISCRAVPQSDGTFHLTGSKMWISGGDHDMAENIVHMVLAKIDRGEGLTPGTEGISLFLVPKYLLDAGGRPGRRNGIEIAGVNHKMGQRGIVNTVPVLGAGEPCVGYLLGEPGRGLAGMFHMMNEARIGIGYGAAAAGYAGYRYSLAYAKERRQGRALGDPDPTKPPVPIIEHADVRRMLLAQKSYTEGSLALCLYAAELVDRLRTAVSDEEANRLRDLLAVLTPMVKTWPSTWCLHANYLAIQVLGGYGYTRDFPVERMYRDNRINEIHEGTTGIQSLDLVGRKLLRDGGASFRVLLDEIRQTIAGAGDSEWSDDLESAVAAIEETALTLGSAASRGDVDLAMANSVVFLDMCGTVAVAWMWFRAAVAAAHALGEDRSDEDFYQGKLAACRYFYRWELPRVHTQSDLLRSLEDTPLRVAPQML